MTPINNETNLHITPKNDIIFKKIFGSKGNEDILKDFLEAILDTKIDSLKLDLATELLPDFYNGKQSRIDVRTTLSDGTEVNVEMQMKSSGYSDKRCMQLWSKLYSNTLEAGSDYNSLRKTICIWILNENAFPETQEFQTKWKIFEDKNLVENHFNDLEFHIIELKKLREHGIINLNNKNLWLWFIDHSDRGLINMACENNNKIKEAREQLDKLRADKELMERIRLEETYEMDVRTLLNNAKNDGLEAGKTVGEAIGLEKGEAIGLEKGSAKKQKEIALNLLKLNMPIEQISQATGLSADEIEKLKVENEK